MYLFVEGVAVGFSIAAPVGAIGFLCIEETLRRGIPYGIASGLGAATADMMYGILVALGLKATQTVLLAYKAPLMLVGGLFLCYLGIKKFLTKPALHKAHALRGGLLRAYMVTFFLTFINPATILEFTALFTGLNIDVAGTQEALSFVVGVFLGSVIWWFALAFTVGTFRSKISKKVLQYINYIAGMIIFAFGLYSLSKIWS